MLFKVIQTDNYILVVEDSEIKEGDTVYYTIYGEDEYGKTDKEPYEVDISTVREITSLKNIKLTETSLIALPSECKKIIAHLPLNNSPILEGVDLLPPLEDESKLPIAFECKMETKQIPEFHKDSVKTTTNSQGQTVWVGTYKY